MTNFFQKAFKRVTKGISKAAKAVRSIGKKPLEAGLKIVGDLGQAAVAKVLPLKEMNDLFNDTKAFSKDVYDAMPKNVQQFVTKSWMLQPTREFIDNQQLVADILSNKKELTISSAKKLFPVINSILTMIDLASDFSDIQKKRARRRMLRNIKQMMESWYNVAPGLFGPAHAIMDKTFK